MDFAERRQHENAQLRAKIDHIQNASQELQVAIQKVQNQTLNWARQHKLTELPSEELANNLSVTFKNQKMALSQIQDGIKGMAAHDSSQRKTQLVTDEELSALMK